MGVLDYSTTPASNTSINSIGIAGTNSPANFDNAFRQLMADIATAREDGSLASMPYATKSSGYTLALTDRGKLIECTAALEIELLAAASATGFYFIAKANGGAVTLDPNSTENINGSSTSLVVADGTSAIVACNGTAWFTVAIGQGDVTQTGTQTLTNKTLTSPTLTTPTLTLKQSSTPTPTTEGDIQWDTDDNVLVVGDGAATQILVPIPASTAAGDLLYLSGAKVYTRLAKGTAAQALLMNAGATAPSWVTVPFTKSFESAQQSITTAGALTLAHGLGTTPKLYIAVLQCTTAEFGYSIGNETPIADNNNRSLSLVPDGTNITVRIGSSGLEVTNKTTGSNDLITNASWRLVVRAWA